MTKHNRLSAWWSHNGEPALWGFTCLKSCTHKYGYILKLRGIKNFVIPFVIHAGALLKALRSRMGVCVHDLIQIPQTTFPSVFCNSFATLEYGPFILFFENERRRLVSSRHMTSPFLKIPTKVLLHILNHYQMLARVSYASKWIWKKQNCTNFTTRT